MINGSYHVNMINSLGKYYHNIITRIVFPGVLFCVMGCNNDPAEIRALTTASDNKEDRAHDVTIIQSKNGKVQFRLFAREFVRNESAKPAYIDMNRNLKAEFYNDSGQLESVLTADSSRYYISENNVIVWDSVQVVRRKGEQLNTSELIWNNSIEKFFTEKPVRISTNSEVLYGSGMEANSDFSWYRVTNPKGSVQVSKGEVPQ